MPSSNRLSSSSGEFKALAFAPVCRQSTFPARTCLHGSSLGGAEDGSAELLDASSSDVPAAQELLLSTQPNGVQLGRHRQKQYNYAARVPAVSLCRLFEGISSVKSITSGLEDMVCQLYRQKHTLRAVNSRETLAMLCRAAVPVTCGHRFPCLRFCALLRKQRFHTNHCQPLQAGLVRCLEPCNHFERLHIFALTWLLHWTFRQSHFGRMPDLVRL